MTPEMIAAIVGVVISLGLEFIPKVNGWYNALQDSYQKLFTLGVGFVVVAVAFGLGCTNLLVPYWACDWAGVYNAVLAFLAYVLANQTTYALFLKKNK